MRIEEILEKLDDSQTQWFAWSVALAITADQKVSKEEKPHLQKLFGLIDRELAGAIVDAIKKKRKIELEIFKIKDRILATQILFFLVSIFGDDGMVSGSEVETIRYIGSKIGFTKEDIDSVLGWTQKNLKLSKERKMLIGLLTNTNPTYH
ncbi:MAG: hypothetical protein HQM13_02705 [SAR324 cluster bacterium]|nr:hypothetical protein [SAR324 cluster bacterium]